MKGRTTLKVNRFSDEQIIHLLQQAERGEQPIGVLCHDHGISEQTFYRWRKKFGGMTVPDAQRLRELEQENGRLKRLLAERDLEVDALKALLSKKSCRWRHAGKVVASWLLVGSRSAGPVFCCSCTARPWTTSLVPIAMRCWLLRSTSWPSGIRGRGTGGCGRCSGVAVSR